MVLPNECHNIEKEIKVYLNAPQVYFYKQDNNKCRK